MLTDVELVLADLNDAFSRLKINQSSPCEVRRAFSDYVGASQRLTSVMRKEFPVKWEASKFNKWTYVATLFKELRNYNDHESPIKHNIKETCYMTMPVKDDWPEITLAMIAQLQTDPLATERPSANIVLMEADSKTGRMTNKQIKCVSNQTYEYVISVKSDSEGGRKINNLLKKIGTADLYTLITQYHNTLVEYHAFYQHELQNFVL